MKMIIQMRSLQGQRLAWEGHILLHINRNSNRNSNPLVSCRINDLIMRLLQVGWSSTAVLRAATMPNLQLNRGTQSSGMMPPFSLA